MVPEDSPSGRRNFVCHPNSTAEETACDDRDPVDVGPACVFRRPATDDDVQTLLGFYKTARAKADFDTGIRAALERVLVSPDFLFRIEDDPDAVAPGAAYRVSDIALASRLSFFLWSSIPDDELLDLATRAKLRAPAVLD